MTVKEGLSPLYELCLPPTIDLEVTSKPSEVYVALEIDCFIFLVSKKNSSQLPAPSKMETACMDPCVRQYSNVLVQSVQK